jgi:preprotein translocase subunit SecB
MDESKPAGGEGLNTGQLRLERIYLKDASFESPRSPAVFGEQWQPQFQMDINSRTTGLGGDRFEVLLSVTLRAKTDQGKTAFIAEVQQAGVFHLSGFDGDTLQRVLGTFCPGTLFPYVRETMDALVVKGGFPAVHLAPVNFDALFAEALRKQAAPQGGEPVAH